jgi:uncharacterized protein (TIRG00374 family)
MTSLQWKTALRALCAGGLIVLLSRMIDWQSLPRQLAHLSLTYAMLGFLGLCLQFFTSAWKWGYALRIHGLVFRFWSLVRLYGTAFFLNNFLPSAMGGDAYRVYSTLSPDGLRSRAFSAVLVERMIGFAALLAIGCVSTLWLHERAVAHTFLIFNAVCAAAALSMLAAARAGLLKRAIARWRHTKFVDAIAQNAAYLRNAGAKWWPLLWSSVLFQIVSIAIVKVLFASLGAEVSFASCALIAAVSSIAAALPISINGIGVVEGSFAATAVAVGIDYEIALAVAVLTRLLALPGTLLFGAAYVWRGDAATVVSR